SRAGSAGPRPAGPSRRRAWWSSALARDLRRAEHRPHDVDVAGAATQVAGDHLPRLLLGRVGVVAEPGGDGGQEARGAEAALEAVALGEGLLHGAQPSVG